jgi:hypothetical protein
MRHPVYLYQLRDLTITRSNHVWVADITVQEAINRYDMPAIFNTDPSCQFTSLEFTGLLKDYGIQIAWMDKAAGGTTCSWSGFGRESSMRRSTCRSTSISDARKGLAHTLDSTAREDRTRHWTTKRQMGLLRQPACTAPNSIGTQPRGYLSSLIIYLG